MAATKKTKSAGKTNSKPRAKSRRKKAKKPKVVLSTKKVAVFSTCVCCFCAVFLGLSVVLNGNHGKFSPEKNEKVAAVFDKKTEKSFEKAAEKLKSQKKIENQATRIVEPNGNFSERNEKVASKTVYDSKLPVNSKSSNKDDFKTVTYSKSLEDLKSDASKSGTQNQIAKNNSALKTAENTKSSSNSKSLKNENATKSPVDFKSDASKSGAQNQIAKNNSALKTAENAKSSGNSKSLKNENATKSPVNLKSPANLNSSESSKSKSQSLASTSENQKNAPAKNVSSAQKNSVAKNLSESSSAKNSPLKNPSVLKTEKSSAKSISENLASGSLSSESLSSKNSSSKSAKIEKSPQKIAAVSNLNQNENAQNQALKNPRFDIPKAVNGATVVIVIDDAGRSVENVKRYAALPLPLTIAVLPRLAHSRDCAQISRNFGKEVILHQPMQSVNHNLDPGPGKISVDMSFSEISSIIKENLASLGPGVKGMNNHEGSEVTGDVLRIGAVLDACLENGIYFLDSRTTAQTKAPQAALERDMTIFEKAGPYIDNELSREKMLERLYETLRYANNHGHAIVIGHVDKSVNILPDLLSEMYPYMRAAGYRFATPSTLR